MDYTGMIQISHTNNESAYSFPILMKENINISQKQKKLFPIIYIIPWRKREVLPKYLMN